MGHRVWNRHLVLCRSLSDLHLLLLEKHFSWRFNNGSCLWFREPQHKNFITASNILFRIDHILFTLGFHSCIYIQCGHCHLQSQFSNSKYELRLKHSRNHVVLRLLLTLGCGIYHMSSTVHDCMHGLHVVLLRSRHFNGWCSWRGESVQGNWMGNVVPLWVNCFGVLLDSLDYLHQSYIWVHSLLVWEARLERELHLQNYHLLH